MDLVIAKAVNNVGLKGSKRRVTLSPFGRNEEIEKTPERVLSRMDAGVTPPTAPATARRSAVLLRVLIIALAILAVFLDYSATFWGNVHSAPTATTGDVLLLTVILCLSVSLWAAFVDKEAKRWEGVLVLVGLILGSLLFFFSYFVSTTNLNWMNLTQQIPATINNESIVIDCQVAITIILGLAAIAVFGLILRRAGFYRCSGQDLDLR